MEFIHWVLNDEESSHFEGVFEGDLFLNTEQVERSSDIQNADSVCGGLFKCHFAYQIEMKPIE